MAQRGSANTNVGGYEKGDAGYSRRSSSSTGNSRGMGSGTHVGRGVNPTQDRASGINVINYSERQGYSTAGEFAVDGTKKLVEPSALINGFVEVVSPALSGVNSRGNWYRTPGGTNSTFGQSYQYSNKGGGFFYKNDDGSRYYQDPSGRGHYYPPRALSPGNDERDHGEQDNIVPPDVKTIGDYIDVNNSISNDPVIDIRAGNSDPPVTTPELNEPIDLTVAGINHGIFDDGESVRLGDDFISQSSTDDNNFSSDEYTDDAYDVESDGFYDNSYDHDDVFDYDCGCDYDVFDDYEGDDYD